MGAIPPDLLWKGIIESLIEDFLLLFFPDLSTAIDPDRGFEFLDKELAQLAPESANTRRVADKLIKVFLNDGGQMWVLIHVEVQGYQDPDFSKRLFIYYYRLLDRYGLPVSTLAILVDKNARYRPASYQTAFGGTSLSFEFNTYKLLDHSLEALQMLENPFARVLEVCRLAIDRKKLNEEHLFELMLGLVRRMKAKDYSTEKIRQLMNFLRTYVRFKKKDFIRRFEDEVDVIFKNSKAMGLEEIILEETRKEGELKGMEAKNIQVAYNSWQEGLSLELTAKLTDLPIEKVHSLFLKFATEKSNASSKKGSS